MINYRLYIGSNNQTGELEIDRIYSILDDHLEAYTIQLANGRWKSKNEDSVIVSITTTEKIANRLIEKLKVELDQEAIGLQKEPPIIFK